MHNEAIWLLVMGTVGILFLWGGSHCPRCSRKESGFCKNCNWNPCSDEREGELHNNFKKK